MASLNEALNLEIKETGACGREFVFTLSAEEVDREFARISRMIAGEAQLPGFRPGKAPVAMVVSRYGKEIAEEVDRSINRAALEKVYDEKLGLELVSVIYGKRADVKKGEALEFSFKADIAPKFEIGDYKAVRVEVAKEEVTDADVEKELEDYRNRMGNLKETDDPAKDGDMLKASYKAEFDIPEDASPMLRHMLADDDAFVWVGKNETFPGSSEVLVGAVKGNDYTFTAKFPADYREAAIAGKEIKYQIKVAAVQTRVPLDDEELAERTRVASVDELRKTVRERQEEIKSQKRYADAQKQAMDKILAVAGEFPVPEMWLEERAASELADMRQGADATEFEEKIEEKKAEANKKAAAVIRREFVLARIAKAENIKVDEDELMMRVNLIGRYYGLKGKEANSLVRNERFVSEIHGNMLNDKTLDWLAKNALGENEEVKSEPAAKAEETAAEDK